MWVGYARVSKSDGSQTLALQHDALLAAGVEPSRIYEDLASGRRDDRPGLSACLKALQPGNTLVVWKLDRLGRDLKHLVTTVEELRIRKVGLNSGRRRCADRHHDARGAVVLWNFCGARRIRAGVDRGTDPRRPGCCQGAWTQGRATAQDGSCDIDDGDDRYG